jgi:DNA-binding FadR family transcriptional regulator
MMKIERKSTSQLIIDHLLEQIHTGDLKSGDKLQTERESSPPAAGQWQLYQRL